MVERKELLPKGQREIEGNHGFVWEKVFLAMTDLANKKKEDISLLAPTYNFDAIGSDSQYDLRINAVDTSNGKLEAIVTDLYVDGVHSQQIFVKAAWEKDKPKVTKIDSSAVDLIRPYIQPEIIAETAERLIKINMYRLEEIDIIVIDGRRFKLSEQNHSNLVN